MCQQLWNFFAYVDLHQKVGLSTKKLFVKSTIFPQCEQSYNLPHHVLFFIFKSSILFEKKADYDN